MHRVGVDLVDTSRIHRVLERYGTRFLERVYTPLELAYCQMRVTSLAGRWAAKEAVVKALGCGFGDVHWSDIEVLSDEQGAPYLRLHGEAVMRARSLGLTEWAISLSHTDDHAVAFVVAS
jgi:holo-[acyl-carrier protein] synthase